MSDVAEIINTVEDADGTFKASTIEHNERLARGVIPKVLRLLGRVPFADDLVAAYFAARDSDTPKKAKAVLMAAVAYFVLPIDALPDVILGLGFTDDAAVLATALGAVGTHVKDKHRGMARRILRIPEKVTDADG
ncbi:MAG: YkvA family protein [Hyphomonas sp.]